MRQLVLSKFQQRAEQCEKRARESSDPLVKDLLAELAKDFRNRAKVDEQLEAQ
jgi:ribosomal protein L18E